MTYQSKWEDLPEGWDIVWDNVPTGLPYYCDWDAEIVNHFEGKFYYICGYGDSTGYPDEVMGLWASFGPENGLELSPAWEGWRGWQARTIYEAIQSHPNAPDWLKQVVLTP